VLQDSQRITRYDVTKIIAWAQATGEGEEDENKIIHRTGNGVVLDMGTQLYS
jgi:hypothetical protein